MTTKEESGDCATGEESPREPGNLVISEQSSADTDNSGKTDQGGNGTGGEQSSADIDTDHSGIENQSFEMDAATQKIVEDLKAELSKLDPVANKHSVKLLKTEIERLTTFSEPEYLEVDTPKQIRIVRKVMVPVHRDPKFNFVGRLLGPGGKTLTNLVRTTRCRMSILGRGSLGSKKKAEEGELLSSDDPKDAHLKDPLHVRVEATGPAQIAYQKIANVLNELHGHLQPVKDDIFMQQMADMGKQVDPPPPSGPPIRGGHRGALTRSGPPRGAMPTRGAMRGGGAPRGRGSLIQIPPSGPTSFGAPPPQPSGPPPNPIYPSYNYSGYGNYLQSAPQPPQTAPRYASVQTTAPPSRPPVSPPQVGVPPGPSQPAPPSSSSGANLLLPYPYGFDYDRYYQSVVGTTRPLGPVRPAGGGKAPPPAPIGRGRGMARPSPY